MLIHNGPRSGITRRTSSEGARAEEAFPEFIARSGRPLS
jgi:hypothetical protein